MGIDVRDHISVQPCAELVEYVNEVALLKSRYLFTQRVKAKKFSAYCTYCETESFVEEAIKHNSKTKCPSCSSEVVSKQSGRGRGMMVDHAYVEFASKSLLDPDTFTIAGYYVARDYREDYKNMETSFILSTIYTFSPTEAHMYSKHRYKTVYEENARIHSIHKGTGMYDIPAFCSYKSIDKAIEGTPYQYSLVGDYSRVLIPEYLALFCKYPYIEALAKIGLDNIIDDRLYGRPTKVFNWRGKTLDNIIGLPKRDWKHFRNAKEPITQEHLRNFKQLRTFDPTSDTLTILAFAQQYSVYRLINVMEKTGTNPHKAYRYILKLIETDAEHFKKISDVLSTWDDYIDRALQDGLDMKDSNNVYPKDLHMVHQRQIERARAVADAKNNEAMKQRYEELKHLSFESEELFIRPVESPKELADEGNMLNHCVGSYLNKHLNGTSTIFVVRKASEPDKPFYTVEIAHSQVQQCRGYRNALSTEEVAAFMEQFKEAKLDLIKQELPSAS